MPLPKFSFAGFSADEGATGSAINPYLLESDKVVLQNLFDDVDRNIKSDLKPSDRIPAPEVIDKVAGSSVSTETTGTPERDIAAINRLKAQNDPNSDAFEPMVFVTWDDKDIHPVLNKYIIKPYARYVARNIVRHPTDVVFFTHILLYFTVNLPSALFLYYHFTYLHGVIHTAYSFWCIASFTLMMHNHIHNKGVLKRSWFWLDHTFPYIFEPLMGHTWDSYYYHHVKHHHVEGNGPDDLSSTIRYQRDDPLHFLHYLGRFMFFCWLELPLYFVRKRKMNLALKAFCTEVSSMVFMWYMTAKVNTRASMFVLVIPFVLLRLGLMLGNWGQHALVDELEPDSDFRSSITLIDVPSNRVSFNDGYHTAHHLNPLRHWREQPVHFLQSKEAYRQGRALTFHNIDYLMLTLTLLSKDYDKLADCLVPMGDQVGMTKKEIADMLRTKTRRFTEEDIKAKFGSQAKDVPYIKSTKTPWRSTLMKFAGLFPGALGLMALGPRRVEAEKTE